MRNNLYNVLWNIKNLFKYSVKCASWVGNEHLINLDDVLGLNVTHAEDVGIESDPVLECGTIILNVKLKNALYSFSVYMSTAIHVPSYL